ncbi:MAG: hypothetical protein MUO23_08640, partial [Anaerolineales bacterium]|nr:hypothetical protein [Anaerolineales bacterium]
MSRYFHQPPRERRVRRALITVISLSALLAACQPAGSATSPAAPPGSVPAEAPTSALAPQASAPDLPPVACLTREDLAQLSLAERASLTELCYLSPDGTETTIEQSLHIASIRAFLEDPGRMLAFSEISAMPNSPDGA